MKRVLTACVMFLACVGAQSNGVDFFRDALEPGAKPLVYKGRVTDQTGKPIPNTQIYVTLDRLGVAMEVHGDSDGRFTTHDVRKALEMIGEAVNTSELRIFVKRAYYRQISPPATHVPKVDEGTVEINFTMRRE